MPRAGKSEATVRIPKGSAEATYKVKTSDNGLRRGQHTTADITAFYAEPTTAQLRVESPRR